MTAITEHVAWPVLLLQDWKASDTAAPIIQNNGPVDEFGTWTLRQ